LFVKFPKDKGISGHKRHAMNAYRGAWWWSSKHS